MKIDQWLSDLETGIHELDRENRALMGLTGGVIAASGVTDTTPLLSALVQLHTQAKIDFAREEELMAAFRYKGAAQHQFEHLQLLAEIQHQIDDLENGQAHAPHLVRFQKNWFIQHLLTQDVLLGQALLTHKGIYERRHSQRRQMTEAELDAFEDRRVAIRQDIAWTSQLNIGVEVIDAAHHALVELYNLIINVSPCRDKAQLATLLEQLGNTTAAHFETQEKLMAELDYEDAAAHRKEHQELLNEYGHQVDDWRANRISPEMLCRFMYRWLLNHVIASDKPLGEAIQRQSNRGPEQAVPAGAYPTVSGCVEVTTTVQE